MNRISTIGVESMVAAKINEYAMPCLNVSAGAATNELELNSDAYKDNATAHQPIDRPARKYSLVDVCRLAKTTLIPNTMIAYAMIALQSIIPILDEPTVNSNLPVPKF